MYFERRNGRDSLIAVLIVTVAGLCVYAVQQLAGFPPLIFLGAAAAAAFTVLGVRPGALAVVLAALMSDFLFIKPVLTVTYNTLLLAVLYFLASMFTRYVSRRS